jgi:ribosomal protein L24E
LSVCPKFFGVDTDLSYKKGMYMAKCSFCNNTIETGTGLTVIRNDGKIFRFDSKKCETSMLDLHRDARKMKWITKQDTETK